MGTYTTDILDDTQYQQTVDALCYQAYFDTIPDPNNPGQMISNPLTQEQFAQSQVDAFIQHKVNNYLQVQALIAATPSLVNIGTATPVVIPDNTAAPATNTGATNATT